MCTGKGLTEFLVLTFLVVPARPLKYITYVDTQTSYVLKRITPYSIYKACPSESGTEVGAP
jgi:hypothetical protein